MPEGDGPFVGAVKGGWGDEGGGEPVGESCVGIRGLGVGFEEGRRGEGDAVQGAAWIAGAFPLVSLTVVARAGVEALIGDA